jgi:hypothetical protein
LILGKPDEGNMLAKLTYKIPKQRMIPAPPAVIQLSGPVMDREGRIAAARISARQGTIGPHKNRLPEAS